MEQTKVRQSCKNSDVQSQTVAQGGLIIRVQKMVPFTQLPAGKRRLVPSDRNHFLRQLKCPTSGL